MFRLPRSLGPQIAPTDKALSLYGGRAIYTTQLPGWLPAPGRGIASHPTRATDAAGLSPAELQPCRLLPNPVTPTIDFLERKSTRLAQGSIEFSLGVPSGCQFARAETSLESQPV